MITVFGKGKVGNAVGKLLSFLWSPYLLMDDQDRNNKILDTSKQIIVSPWIPQHHPLYQKYWKKITGELDFLRDVLQEKKIADQFEMIGITGTNGKSTTTWILYTLFKDLFAQQDIPKKVVISGNFWTPLAEVVLETLQSGTSEGILVILEVSSFMLYSCEKFRFDYGILTNIATDHLDWHKDFDEYQYCKIKLLQQTRKTGYALEENYADLDTPTQKNTQIYDTNFDLSQTQFLGLHNQANFKAADKLLRQYYQDHDLDFSETDYQAVLASITPLDHRMKLVKTIQSWHQKIKIIDDGICTSAHALLGALSCFDEKIVLIAGGYDKGEDYTHLEQIFREKVAFASLLGTTGKIKFSLLAQQAEIPYVYNETLQQAIQSALDYAKKNNISVIVFSPWSASFDMFKNVYDRCEQFEKIIEEL